MKNRWLSPLVPLLLLTLAAGFAEAASSEPANNQDDGPMNWVVLLNGEQERPSPVETDAIGTALFTFDPTTFDVTISINVVGLTRAELVDIGDLGPLHLHIEQGDETGPIAVSFGTSADWVEGIGGISLMADGSFANDFTAEEVMAALVSGITYLNLHTCNFQGGEIRGDLPGKETSAPEPAVGLLLLLALVPRIKRWSF